MKIQQRTITLFEDDTHVFIARIWLERRAIKGAPTVWRGMIEHVPSGERHYLKDLDDLTTFIMPYLASLGVKPKLSWRVRQWLKQQQFSAKKQI